MSLPPGITRRGDRYRASVYLGRDPLTGRKLRSSKSFTNLREAVRWRSEQSKAPAGRTKSPERLGDLLERWLDRQRWRAEVEGSLGAGTLSWYTSAVQRHLLLAPIVRTRLRDLTGDELAGFLAEKRARGRLDGSGGLGRSSLRRLTVVLNAALGWAVAEGWIATNPAAAVRFDAEKGSKTARELAWTAADLRRFLDFHREHRMVAAWRLAAVTGMRRGELLGLRWADLRTPDIGNAAVTVRRTWTMVDGRPVLGEGKTFGSARTVPIDGATVVELARWRARQDQDRAAWGEAFCGGGWMFTREDGSPIRPDTFTKVFRRACREAGVPELTPHRLRHLAATVLLEEGVPTAVVADLLGHSSPRITSDTYQHVRESIAAAAVGRIAAHLGDSDRTQSAPAARQSDIVDGGRDTAAGR